MPYDNNSYFNKKRMKVRKKSPLFEAQQIFESKNNEKSISEELLPQGDMNGKKRKKKRKKRMARPAVQGPDVTGNTY